MPGVIIDRRKNTQGKSITNRQKFVKRVKKHVKNIIKKSIQTGKIGDIDSTGSKQVTVPTKNLKEPGFQYDWTSGKRQGVLPGNRDYLPGDWIHRPDQSGSGEGEDGDPGNGEGEDSFDFVITSEEYQDLFFADLELPDMVKRAFDKITEKIYKRDGYQIDGPAGRLNYLQTLRQSIGRRAALRNPRRRVLRELESELAALEALIAKGEANPNDIVNVKPELIRKIEEAKKRLSAVPFIDDFDLRYNRFEEENIPISQAVMFCIMDVSGSMGEWEKEMAKRFYMVLYLFLHRNYEHVDVVFIRHTEIAQECDEDTFFHSQESGGTEVMPALKLTMDIIKERYPLNAWNVYCCQASDGDVFPSDAQRVVEAMNQQVLKMVQYFAYVEIGDRAGQLSSYYSDGIDKKKPNFDQTRISDVADIFPVFRKLFEKKKFNEKA